MLIYLVLWCLSGWTLLLGTSASLLRPRTQSACDRFLHCLSLPLSITKGRILIHILVHHIVILPLAAYLWTIDEVLFASYRTGHISKPVILLSVPRAGTTSFHRTLALDPNLITPRTSEIVMPFICVNIILNYLQDRYPSFLNRIENILKKLNGVTQAVEDRHPISLFSPEADDVLMGEWHWVAVGAIRTFPVLRYWWEHYNFSSFDTLERNRILSFHSSVCKKVLYLRGISGGGIGMKRLLLRSHLSPCIDDFKKLYLDAIFIGIFRNPVDVLRSFAGLSDIVIYSATGVRMLQPLHHHTTGEESKFKCSPNTIDRTNLKIWPDGMQVILDDMMGREARLHSESIGFHTGKITFHEFKDDPVASIKTLYQQVGLEMRDEFVSNMKPRLDTHWEYKKDHQYHNPTFSEMGVDEDRFLSMPGVKLYSSMLNGATRS